MGRSRLSLVLALVLVSGLSSYLQPAVEAGLIKNIFQKITHTNNKTEDTVKQSIPICGNGIFSTPDESSLSPELIFISTRPSRIEPVRSNQQDSSSYRRGSNNNNNNNNNNNRISEVSKEFRFHADNVTVEELQRYGFNPQAPVSFLIHGFTSGYPLQAWISAIVEAYTIDRETSGSSGGSSTVSQQWPGDNSEYSRESSNSDNYNNQELSRHKNDNSTSSNYRRDTYRRDDRENQRTPINNKRQYEGSSSNTNANHNLFIVNWHYAARGIIYPRAVANIPIVASYVTRFINNKLLDEARVDPQRIQLIGHSLGAHLAGFIGKNTRSKVGRIYGLDPAGPCFGTISGPLYPASKRLAPSDAQEVITIQTNSALLGIERPLGKYSVYVEGGANQPGCKPSGVLKSIGTLTFDGGDFDTVACSHSRAPNLLTYRHDQTDAKDNCQMVAYACKDWDSFLAGHCGVCSSAAIGGRHQRRAGESRSNPLDPVECYRIGLDWQYPKHSTSNYNHNSQGNHHDHSSSSSSMFHDNKPNDYFSSTTRRPSGGGGGGGGYDNQDYSDSNYNTQQYGGSTTRRPFRNNSTSNYNSNYSSDRLRRRGASSSNSTDEPQVDERRGGGDESVEPTVMFLRTGDTQPYCTFHYQVVLELNEPLPSRKKPSMSLILQDSEFDTERGNSQRKRTGEQNSLSTDEFGNKFNDRMYTHLLTSNKKLARIDHATMIIRDGLPDGYRLLKSLHVNYMSHAEPQVRKRLSSRLCPVKTEVDRSTNESRDGNNRFYFKPCGQQQQQNQHHSNAGQHSNDQRDRENNNQNDSNYSSSYNSSNSSNYNNRENNNYNNRDKYQ